MSSSNVAASSEKLRANWGKPRAMGLVTCCKMGEVREVGGVQSQGDEIRGAL